MQNLAKKKLHLFQETLCELKKTREEEHAKKQPKKRGQKLWDTELPVVALVHRTQWARVTNNVKNPQSQMCD